MLRFQLKYTYYAFENLDAKNVILISGPCFEVHNPNEIIIFIGCF